MYWFVLKSVLLIASFVDDELHLITHYRVFAVKIFDKALVVATDKACRDLIKHHETMLTALEEDPAALVAAATAHCSALASPESVPETMLSLRAYQLDPSFLWAPFDARDEKLMWAYNAAIAQLAAFTQPFLELADDCAGMSWSTSIWIWLAVYPCILHRVALRQRRMLGSAGLSLKELR